MNTAETQMLVSNEEWDDVRHRFRDSMMAKTEVGKLAQNLDLSWPLKGTDEIPLKYVPLSADEVMMMPGLTGHPERFRLLVEILSETMAFDDPFSDMAEHVDSSSKHDDGSIRALEKLEIPLDFPLPLCALSPETRDFCRAEEVATIGQFINFAQGMAQNIVVGGDFRSFLNAVAHPEEQTIARFLPFRPGRRGLHLAEALAQTLSLFDASRRVFLLERCGATVSASDHRDARPLSPDEKSDVRRRAIDHANAVFSWFARDRDALVDAFAEGRAQAERIFIPLEDPALERFCLWLSTQALGLEAASPTTPPKSASTGFFGRLFGRR